MKNQVVAHFADGRILKGWAIDFFPNRTSFHLEKEEAGETLEVQVGELKGVFFVKTFDGDSQATYRNDVERSGMGKKIQVDFSDGETLIGYTSGYSPARAGFFVFPADPNDNNDKVYVVTAATTTVTFV
jgi:hypothetical protein